VTSAHSSPVLQPFLNVARMLLRQIAAAGLHRTPASGERWPE
jgi:hypothetical protein